MLPYLKKIQGHPLFEGIRQDQLPQLMECLGCYTRIYRKREIIILSEDPVKMVGIILHGGIHMVKENTDGSETLLVYMGEGELFGETFACGSSILSRVTFRTAVECEVLYLPFYKVIHTCTMPCMFHHRLIENMVMLLCEKNVQLMEKIEITSRKTLRDKILEYLKLRQEKAGEAEFEIPLGRVEWADYLCADRSALTRELARMEEEGLLTYQKNRFCIKV